MTTSTRPNDDQLGALLRDFGAARCWTQPGQTVTGVGTSLSDWCWPINYTADVPSVQMMPVWPNPDLWDEKPRWNGNNKWPLPIPWHPTFVTGRGSDFGTIIRQPDGTDIEIQGLSTVEWWHALAINIRMVGAWRTLIGQGPCHPGQWRADGIGVLPPGAPTHGSQGPWRKTDGLLTPQMLATDQPWSGPLRLVVANVQHGPGATAAKDAWVEHPNGRPDNPTWLPRGNDPRCLPSGTHLRLEISDHGIEQWLGDTRGPLRATKLRFARGLRDHGMRVSETGTGDPIIESVGALRPQDKRAWADLGVTTDRHGGELGAGLFSHAGIVAVAA